MYFSTTLELCHTQSSITKDGSLHCFDTGKHCDRALSVAFEHFYVSLKTFHHIHYIKSNEPFLIFPSLLSFKVSYFSKRAVQTIRTKSTGCTEKLEMWFSLAICPGNCYEVLQKPMRELFIKMHWWMFFRWNFCRIIFMKQVVTRIFFNFIYQMKTVRLPFVRLMSLFKLEKTYVTYVTLQDSSFRPSWSLFAF